MSRETNTDAEAQRARLLGQLAAGIARRRLGTPARLLLDIVTPVDVLASQAALLVAPFVPHGRWRDYVGALERPSSWKALHRMLDDHDS